MTGHWANPYVGLPFRDRGRDRGGLDCWGLARLVSREVFARELPEYEYASSRDVAGVARALVEASTEYDQVLEGDARPGDLIGLEVRGLPHVGVVCGAGDFLHVLAGRDVTVERWSSVAWRPRIRGFYRPRAGGGCA